MALPYFQTENVADKAYWKLFAVDQKTEKDAAHFDSQQGGPEIFHFEIQMKSRRCRNGLLDVLPRNLSRPHHFRRQIGIGNLWCQHQVILELDKLGPRRQKNDGLDLNDFHAHGRPDYYQRKQRWEQIARHLLNRGDYDGVHSKYGLPPTSCPNAPILDSHEKQNRVVHAIGADARALNAGDAAAYVNVAHAVHAARADHVVHAADEIDAGGSVGAVGDEDAEHVVAEHGDDQTAAYSFEEEVETLQVVSFVHEEPIRLVSLEKKQKRKHLNQN